MHNNMALIIILFFNSIQIVFSKQIIQRCTEDMACTAAYTPVPMAVVQHEPSR